MSPCDGIEKEHTHPKEVTDPFLIVVSISAVIPNFGSAALIAGNVMLLYYFSVNVQAASGYFILALILVSRPVQVSLGEGFPSTVLLPQSITFCFKTEMHLSVFPFGANQILSISDASLHLRLCNDIFHLLDWLPLNLYLLQRRILSIYLSSKLNLLNTTSFCLT